MGKKKSTVLMVLITILIVVMSVVTLVSFPLSEVNSFNPTVLQFDLGADLGGGYYAYYYPEGIKTETEFVEDGDSADDYVQHGSLYLSKERKYGLVTIGSDGNATVSEEFDAEFKAAAKTIAQRLENRGYSDYRVAIVDDYALRVELPASDNTANATLTGYCFTGEITLTKGTASAAEKLDELKADDAKITDYISGFSVAHNYKWSYLKIHLTKAGKELVNGIKSELSTASASSDASATALYLQIGDAKLTGIYQDNITDNDIRTMYVENNAELVETYEVLLNSALHNSFSFTFRDTIDVQQFDAVYGENVLTLLYIALGVAILAAIVAAIVTMRGYGVSSAYASMTYLLVVATFLAFITGNAAFEVTLGTVLAFLLGFVLMNGMQYYIYHAIKAEFALGKTVQSSVKGGYKKTLWSVVDVYVVALLGALSLLLGGGGLATLAWQAVICVLTAAFCNLLWARVINCMLLSTAKNQYKYFRFVREDDEDDE